MSFGFFDMRSYQQEWDTRTESNRTTTTPVNDPTGSLWRKSSSLLQDFGGVNFTCVVKYGRIVESFPYLNCYRVMTEADSIVLCSLASHNAFMPFGSRDIAVLPPGVGVFYIQHPTTHNRLIIGTDAPAMTRAAIARSDMVSQGSNVGLHKDATHNYVLSLPSTDLIDFSAGRPMDGLAGGEWGVTTETGGMIFLDPFMFQARMDEETGIWMFYHDQLTRIAGKNLQIRSSGYEREDLDDENELTSRESWCLYPWEAVGAFSSTPPTLTKEFTAGQVQSDKAFYGMVEPLNDDQQPFYRYQEYKGYLGQLSKRMAFLPDLVADLDGSLNRHSTQRKWFNCWDEHILPTGRYLMSSAKGLVLMKRPLKPAPKMMARPEDLTGDVSFEGYGVTGTYKASGTYGNDSAPNHTLSDNIAYNDTETLPVARRRLINAALLLDDVTVRFNFECLTGFYYHPLDWYYPEESAMEGYSAASAINYSALQTQQYFNEPDSVTKNVDFRYGNVKYFKSNAYFVILDDGTIVVSDGYETTVRMTGGNAEVDCPGDIWLKAGKNINLWAGNDIVLRARDSIDATTTNKDIRLKSQQNIQAVAGVGGCGGVLLESWSTCLVDPSGAAGDQIGENAQHSGIILKAPTSQVALAGQHVFIESSCWEDRDPTKVGNIHLDAHTQTIRQKAMQHERFVMNSGTIFDTFLEVDDFGEDTVVSTNEWWSDRAVLCTDLSVNGQVSIGECLYAGGCVYSAEQFKSERADEFGNAVMQSTSQEITKLDTVVADTSTRCGVASTYGQQEYETLMEYITGTAIDFTYRTAEQYGYSAADFYLFESRWQQMARMRGVIPGTWGAEPSVIAYDPVADVGAPYPGPAYLGSTPTKSGFYTVDTDYFMADTQAAADRGAAYKEPEFNPSVAVALSSYPVIMA